MQKNDSFKSRDSSCSIRNDSSIDYLKPIHKSSDAEEDYSVAALTNRKPSSSAMLDIKMQKNDSSKSRDSRSIKNSKIDNHTPIRIETDVECYYSAGSQNHNSSSSDGSSTFSSQNFPATSSISPPPSSSNVTNQIMTENQVYRTQYENLLDEYELCSGYFVESSKQVYILSHENAALRLIYRDLKDLLTEVSADHQKNQCSAYTSSGFPSLPVINDFLSLSIGRSDTKNDNRGV